MTTTTSPSEWASESGHWYTRTGEPRYTVIGANGKERDTTLRDARKLSLLPSVTGVIRCAAAPGLEVWKQRQVLLAALTLPRRIDEAEEPWLGRVMVDSRETARRAAEDGQSIHGAIEEHFRGKPPPRHQSHVAGLLAALAGWCGPQEWLPEKAFANTAFGYGGRLDLHSVEWLWDYKTKEFDASSPPEIYDDHLMQLAACLAGTTGWGKRAGIAFISRTVPGLTVLTEASEADLARGWGMFRALTDYWWAKNESREYRRFG
jgi:hypothetical protein